MEDLRAKLAQAKSEGARFMLVSTDGVFSMDGIIARLDEVHAIAAEFGTMVHFDDCHATGFLGATGRGTHEYRGLLGKIDLTTGTLGKALGGASGGYTSGRKEMIDLLRQRSRPYLFSNSIAPPIVAASLKVFEMLSATPEWRDRVEENTRYFRQAMTEAGFTLAGADHPICPVMLGDAALSQKFSERLLDHGIYAIGFFYPVVPEGKARIRTQISAAHDRTMLEKAVEAFVAVKKELGV
jgi:glycine C-acetyltransferase